jgi:hypothetical protein
MQAQLAPCQDLEELVERPRAARQHHDRVGIHEHDLLAFMHRLGDDEGREIALADLHLHQMVGITPKVSPPAAWAARATAPIRPTSPAP